MKYLIILTLVKCLVGCQRQCSCFESQITNVSDNGKYQDAPYKVFTIPFQPADSFVKSDAFFGRQLVRIDTLFYYCTLIKNRGIQLYGIENSDTIRTINLDKAFTLFPQSGYNIIVREDTMHIVDITKNNYYRVQLTLKGLKILDSLDLKPLLPHKSSYFYTKIIEPTMEYRYPFLYIFYADRKKKNFIDNKAFLKLNVTTKKLSPIISFPECYKCSSIYEPGCSIAVLDDGSTVTLFDKYDELFKTNLSDEVLKSVFINHKCTFEDFDESKEKNLAYVRKQLALTEKNLRILNINDTFLMVIKRNKKQMNEKDRLSVFVFDKSLNQLFSTSINHSVEISGIFRYKDGVLLFDQDNKTAWYYDFFHK